MAKKYTKSEIEGMIKNLKEKEKKARSKWGKAVLQDAQWLLENVLENMKDGEEVEINETLLLNGAKSWKDFSYGGCAYVANIDIARHYATPSQFKQLEKKDWEISENETLCDVQARALRQAWWAIRDEMNGTTEFSMSLCEFEEKKGESNFDMDKDEYWGLLIEYGIATEDELQLITSINGYSEETLDDVLYARTGYRSWEQYCEANDIENEDDDDDDDDDEGEDKDNMSIHELSAQHDARKSFYGKAQVDVDDKTGVQTLYSYGTKVAQYNPKTKKFTAYPEAKYSATTKRHVREFMKQNGVPASEFSIIDDTKDVLKATGKLAGNIVKNTTDKGGLLMF